MKRVIDAIGSSVALVLLLPILLVVAILVFADVGSPVLFRQRRAGRFGVPFELLKFRTMRDAHDESGAQIPDEEHVTRLGRFLRSSSLDELPGLYNVLRGEMSLVGPRPLYVEYLEHYTAEEARRHDVRPGITGLAQVSGRNALGWEAKFALDVRYVEEHNIWMDFAIMLRTVSKVMKRQDVQVITGGNRRLDTLRARRSKQS
jgi:sugar transferase EpsL